MELFRGDPKPISIEDFDPEYGTRHLLKDLGSSLSEGPGIYFTTQEEDARLYGSNITRKTLQDANILTKESPRFNYRQIEKILQGVGKEAMELATSNWDENPNVGKRMLMESIMSADNPVDQLIVIWSNVFYHQNPAKFMELMTRNGIDGIAKHKEDATYYAIYNRGVLK